jgi:hypothetical protein
VRNIEDRLRDATGERLLSRIAAVSWQRPSVGGPSNVSPSEIGVLLLANRISMAPTASSCNQHCQE